MEFERKICLTALEKGPRTLKFEASEAERLELAARFDLLKLAEFKGEATAVQQKGNAGVTVEGRFRAKLSQRCGVSLEPVPDVLSGSFMVRFVEQVDGEAEMDPENAEDIEVLAGEEIDIGEIAAQYLATALNPYPRKKGSEAADLSFTGGEILSEEQVREKANPFSLLKNLRDRG
jgi:uncharacterized metal-binding protein YceD (DUF177 family)